MITIKLFGGSVLAIGLGAVVYLHDYYQVFTGDEMLFISLYLGIISAIVLISGVRQDRASRVRRSR